MSTAKSDKLPPNALGAKFLLAFAPCLASRITGLLLGESEQPVRQLNDAVRELTNMTAGNFKSSLPGKNDLSTPRNSIVRSTAEVDGAFYQSS